MVEFLNCLRFTRMRTLSRVLRFIEFTYSVFRFDQLSVAAYTLHLRRRVSFTSFPLIEFDRLLRFVGVVGCTFTMLTSWKEKFLDIEIPGNYSCSQYLAASLPSNQCKHLHPFPRYAASLPPHPTSGPKHHLSPIIERREGPEFQGGTPTSRINRPPSAVGPAVVGSARPAGVTVIRPAANGVKRHLGGHKTSVP